MKKILFLCSRNRLRSPTAEAIFKGVEGWEVSSAGINNDAEVMVSTEDLEWADYIFVMEKMHKKKLSSKFGQVIKNKKIVSLDIPDNYEYMDDRLVAILQAKIPSLVQ
ncbi:phosphotyrosine protein phosphatase [Bowmanella sp. Y26]|uniref:low molecular weight protein tyrosine phosphatase family protein n=1 Tax=Bowmanella yangjiangensis TaxID=2811230 RepID=UPI001BDBC0D4|nr:phosphotyrosine protein phosphatase [Bowmanella yangjiangensis]MBT1064403.1 phosphotyrosine protein phosphatase [Bowmanella yangjiangensis]